MSFSRYGRWLVSHDSLRVTRLWDLESTDDQGKVVGEMADQYSGGGSVVFSPVGDQFAVRLGLSYFSRLRLFDPRVTDLREPLKEMCLPGTLQSMDYSPNDQRLVLGTGASSVLLWDLQSFRPHFTLEGHTGAVLSVAYSPCGKWIFSGSQDKTVRLWSGEVDSWSCVAVVSGFSEAITSVAWNPVVPLVFATGSDDGSVRVWRISSTEDGDVSICMRWSSYIGQLYVVGLTFKGAVGLSPLSEMLLIQRDAINEDLEGDDLGPREEIE